MPDFTPAEIDLARELALPREFREGDWYVWLEYPTLSPTLPALATNGMYADAEYVWLPLEGDCFALLREAGVSYDLQADAGANLCCVTAMWDDSTEITLTGATPREALYRLLLAVREEGR